LWRKPAEHNRTRQKRIWEWGRVYTFHFLVESVDATPRSFAGQQRIIEKNHLIGVKEPGEESSPGDEGRLIKADSHPG